MEGDLLIVMGVPTMVSNDREFVFCHPLEQMSRREPYITRIARVTFKAINHVATVDKWGLWHGFLYHRVDVAAFEYCSYVILIYGMFYVT